MTTFLTDTTVRRAVRYENVDPRSIEFNHTHDDVVNSYVETASWRDGTPLSDSECDELTSECWELIEQDFLEWQISCAEYAADTDR